jgi:hypothetical protein
MSHFQLRIIERHCIVPRPLEGSSSCCFDRSRVSFSCLSLRHQGYIIYVAGAPDVWVYGVEGVKEGAEVEEEENW